MTETSFTVLFIGAAVIILIVQVVVRFKRFANNEASPQMREAASLVRKRHTGNGDTANVWYLYFDVCGEELKCRVPRRVYKQLEEGMYGFLTHQGTRFYSFEVGGTTVYQ